ncbi:MAG: quinone-dependent dihydroorotate dehydrogenase [Saprospiraceae bacterium]|nr:quinone-dependent dihydroorotate dehydrogenase [Saprospiraceae bacterium]
MPSLYHLLQPVLFRLDAEKAHHLTMGTLQNLADIPPAHDLMKKMWQGDDQHLSRQVFGLTFKNPIGLAAGFDKNAQYIRELALLGFGYIEIGTLTPRPQIGNPKPRLFRLPEDRALINRMGFNNEGVDAAVRRLEILNRPEGLILGGNIGKNKDTPNEKAVEDYLICLKKLKPWVDYFVVNVSSPNTPGLRELQDKEPLRRLLLTLQEENQKHGRVRPLLLKIAPDLEHSQLNDIVEISAEAKLAGLVATNTTISRDPLVTEATTWQEIGAGGLSGAPLRERSNDVLGYLSKHCPANMPLIGVGGIDSPASAREKFANGASLIQVYSGLIFAGPQLVKSIKTDLRLHPVTN